MAYFNPITKCRSGHSVRYGLPECSTEVPQIECRCLNPQCGKLFFVGNPAGPQKVKCPRCKTDNYFIKE